MHKVVSILSINLLSGSTGSSKIAHQISEQVQRSGNDSFSIVGYQKSETKNEKPLYSISPMSLGYYLWVALNFFFDIFTPNNLSYERLRKYKEYQRSDILHFHTIQGGYFDYRDLPKITKEKRVIWTLHDDWFCAGNDKNNSLFPYKTRRSFEKRKEIFQKSDIHIVAVSDWMYQKAISSGIFPPEKIHLIRNGIDTSVFFPQERALARKELNIPLDQYVSVSIAGAGRKSKAKGVNIVEKIAKQYEGDDTVHFYTLGNKSESKKGNISELGFIDPELIVLYFSAADVFLYPTQADSFGLVIAESIACGCPVLTFDVGATAEMVINKETGYAVPLNDIDELSRRFELLKKNPFRVSQENIPFDLSINRMNTEYMDLYKSILL